MVSRRLVRSVRSPIRWSHYLGDARKAGAEVRALSTVTRILTNQGRYARYRALNITTTSGKSRARKQAVVLAGSMVGAKSAAVVELRDGQARQRPWQCERTRRPLHDDAPPSRRPGDVRRGCSKSHGHDCRAVHVLRRYAKTSHSAPFGSSFVTAGFALEDERPCQLPWRFVWARTRRLHEARSAQFCGDQDPLAKTQPEMENRVELTSAKDEFGNARLES